MGTEVISDKAVICSYYGASLYIQDSHGRQSHRESGNRRGGICYLRNCSIPGIYRGLWEVMSDTSGINND